MEKPKVNPYLFVIIGVLSVSTSAIFVKFSTAPSGVIAFYRLFFTVLIMLPIYLIKYVKELRNMTKKDYILSTIAGVFLAFHFILWFESLDYTSVASSTVLVTLQPLFSFFGTYLLFKDPISAKTIFSAVVAISGSVMISWGDFYLNEKALIGDILALIACLFVNWSSGSKKNFCGILYICCLFYEHCSTFTICNDKEGTALPISNKRLDLFFVIGDISKFAWSFIIQLSTKMGKYEYYIDGYFI